MKTISQETYNSLRAKINAFDKFVRKHFTVGGSDTVMYDPIQIPPEIPSVSNGERSQVEVFEFVHHKPKKYNLYIRPDGPKSLTFTAITFSGDTLGRGKFVKKISRKVNATSRVTSYKIAIEAVNGCKYEGTYHFHAGNHATVERVK